MNASASILLLPDKPLSVKNNQGTFGQGARHRQFTRIESKTPLPKWIITR
uniref:Uncharacterized protein n=1 Tax=uncultured bacterium A1Q1_fos_2004 TaxID=1256557 RepID=L7W1B9_9BACT|nr:hypothetical protein [uncultured bacterium A1Q1_fos_2004]